MGLCFGWGIGFLFLPSTAILPAWFSSRRSLAVGIATSGVGIGGLVYNLAAGAALETLGLEWSYRVFAFCALVANLVSSLFLRDRNKSVKPVQTAFDWREYTHMEVNLVLLWGCLTELGYVILLYSLPNYANSIGLTSSQGSVVSAVLSLSLGISRPAIGHYSDRFGRINVALFITLLCAIFCFAIWVPTTTYAQLVVFALLAGACCGVFWSTVGPVTAEVTGLQRFPSAFGMICVLLILPATFAEPIALQMVSSSGYVSAQVFVGCMFLAGASSLWCLRSWKLHDIHQKAQREEWGESVARRNRHGFWLTPRNLISLRRV